MLEPDRMRLRRGVWVIFLALGLLELLLRGQEWGSQLTPANRAIRQQTRLMYRDERDQPYLFGHRPNAKATLERGPYRFTFISNAEGLREVQDYQALERSVIFLGDSIVEGSSVENHETMDTVFEELTGIASLNFGLGSANTIQEYHWLVSKHRLAYRTVLVVLGFCLNDFEQNTCLRVFDERTGGWRILRYLDVGEAEPLPARGAAESPLNWVKPYVKSSRAAYALWGFIRRWTVGRADFWRAEVVTEAQRRHTAHHLQRLRVFVEEIGALLVVIMIPMESQLTRSYGDGGRMQDVLIELLAHEGIPYVDLHAPMQHAYQAQPDVDWYYDEAHPYKAGHRLIGELLAAELPRMFPEVRPLRLPP